MWTLISEDEDGTYPIGYVLDEVLAELLNVPQEVRGEVKVDEEEKTIQLLAGLATEQERTRAIANLSDHWRQNETFKILKKWRNELWPVYGRKGELLFSMERTALGLFGAMRYGVHMMAYVKDDTAPYGMKLWIPRRAADKSTFPGMLDNTVAGGLMTGEDPFECMIREADEEASLPEAIVREKSEHVGTVTYIYITNTKQHGTEGLVYPECQWVYHLELDEHVIPKPNDGEAEGFYLRDVESVKEDLAQGKFKDNCALVLIDFFVKKGILTKDNEKDLREIETRMHRTMPFPGPHQPDWKAAE